ncbi:YceI family protein [Marinifilum fragile]|uniref:YceI family protein n=1 Tax=Marinifilum fragile TaxID=570161 RepID=UPI0006D01B10|nr:YceI family protein [Marinifilum fragile]
MNFRIFIILTSVICLSIACKAQELYRVQSGFVSFFSSAPLEDIYAENKKVKSIINLASGEFAFVIPISGFQFKKSLMQTHFNDKYLESDQYPNATFTGTITYPKSLNKTGENHVVAVGVIKIHGVEQKISIPANLTIAQNKLLVQSEFILKPKDFDIKIPRILIKNIAEDVLVNVDLQYLSLP